MNLALFGATGRTGSRILQRALDVDHHVRVLVREPKRLTAAHPHLGVVVGDPATVRDVEATIAGCEAVLFAIAPRDAAGKSASWKATRNVVRAMESMGIAKLVITLSGWIFYPKVPAQFEALAREHARQLAALEESLVDWIAVCPTQLTDAPGGARYEIAIESMPGPGELPVSRDDVAHFMLHALGRDDLVRRRVGIADVSALLD